MEMQGSPKVRVSELGGRTNLDAHQTIITSRQHVFVHAKEHHHDRGGRQSRNTGTTKARSLSRCVSSSSLVLDHEANDGGVLE